jgi:hypothetical protein
MRLVKLRSACALFHNPQGRLLEVVQWFLRCGLPALMIKPVQHDKQPFFYSLLCEGIAKKPLQIVINHRKRPICVQSDQSKTKTWMVAQQETVHNRAIVVAQKTQAPET